MTWGPFKGRAKVPKLVAGPTFWPTQELASFDVEVRGKVMVYKFTKRDLMTRGGYQWVVGEWRETSGEGRVLGPGWLHAYDHPLLAVLQDPIGANCTATADALFWEAEAEGQRKEGYGLDSGYTRLRLVREVLIPEITPEQRTRYAIGCAWRICRDPGWRAWAHAWLSGENRTAGAATNAQEAIFAATRTVPMSLETLTWAMAQAAAAAAWTAVRAVEAEGAWAAMTAAWAVAAALEAAREALTVVQIVQPRALALVVQEILPFAAIAEWAITDVSLVPDDA